MFSKLNSKALLVLACALAGCQAYPPVGPALETGDASLIVSPRLKDTAGRTVQAVVAPYTASSINHLTLTLYRVSGGTETEVQTAEVSGAQIPTAQVTFAHLRSSTLYRIRATAYLTSDSTTPISVAAGSTIDIDVQTSDSPTLAAIPVTLADRPFDATGATGATIVPGAILPLGNTSAYVGGHASGFRNDTSALNAQFASPTSLAMDADGNLYVADSQNRRIRKITPDGAVTTFAGTGQYGMGDGPAATATFQDPKAIALNPAGTVMYVGDYTAVRTIDMATGTVATLAGGTSNYGYQNGPAASARFTPIEGLAVDGTGKVYVADPSNYCIRLIESGTVTTFSGSQPYQYAVGMTNGPVASATFRSPSSVLVDASGVVYVGDTANNAIRKIENGVVTTLAGGTSGLRDGTGTAAAFNYVKGLSLDAAGNLYVADSGNHRIRKVTPAGVVTTLVANHAYTSTYTGYRDGEALTALFSSPGAVLTNPTGDKLYVADSGNHRIRQLSAGVVTTTAGSSRGYTEGYSTNAAFNQPTGMARRADGVIVVADTGNHVLRTIDANGSTTRYAGSNTAAGFIDGPAQSAQFNAPRGIAYDASGALYVADSGNHLIRKVSSNGTVSVLAGNRTGAYVNGATALASSFDTPSDVAVDAEGTVYVADSGNDCIRKITAAGVVSTLAGQGVGSGLALDNPQGVAVDARGNLYVSDTDNHRLCAVSPTGVVTLVAGAAASGFANGTGAAATFKQPKMLRFDAAGNMYVVDSGNHAIRMVAPDGTVTTVAGSGVLGLLNDPTGTSAASAARFSSPTGLAVDPYGRVYVADTDNNVIRVVQ